MLRQLVLVLSVVAIIWIVSFAVRASGRLPLDVVAFFLFMSSYFFLVFYYALKSDPPTNKPTYLSLFFERRRLEEQAKIDKLKSEAK